MLCFRVDGCMCVAQKEERPPAVHQRLDKSTHPCSLQQQAGKQQNEKEKNKTAHMTTSV
uniref:Uncharacterized protein n=1 Tax=Anopheles dirus TaxID=7168 RepID=A0A182MZV7_9DIPT